ncbi:MAG TPA: hypothetical protein VM491_10100, partial [Burkholderiaceae bacterium]|nr:hypothetical protein [Burkholderiaceae bacterium]
AGGILVEARSQGPLQRLVIGCGLNLQPSTRVGDAADAAAVALRPAGAGDAAAPRTPLPVGFLFAAQAAPPRRELAVALAQDVLAAFATFAQHGFAPFAQRWRELDAYAGREVELRLPDGTRQLATAVGIDEAGGLQVRVDGELRTLLSAEVSVRVPSAATSRLRAGARSD